MAPICVPQTGLAFIMGFQGHVLQLATNIPTVLPVIGMPLSSPTIPNQQWEFLPINGPLASVGFIESGVQEIFLSVQTQPAPASVQATGQRSSLTFNFGTCVNSTAGLILVQNENTTLALTAWPTQFPELPTPVTYEEYLGLESQVWTFIPADSL
ncbi:hypothetical protein MSAN_00272000 [Mycena sanguinolenta]|uniref:Uncharacterized protein n=1 Tax=Mycena sanguinolenta TaxID=230812 RepID=A0A8H6ZGB0_9AGAR|nr:hypothetical protein MSAN_00272000 [Mycena sanguinolenta]